MGLDKVVDGLAVMLMAFMVAGLLAGIYFFVQILWEHPVWTAVMLVTVTLAILLNSFNN